MKKILVILGVLLLVAIIGYSVKNYGITGNVVSAPAEHQHHMIIYSEEQFIREMIPHHQEAVDTSFVMLGSSDVRVRDLANRIISAQRKEIGEMQKWHAQWFSTQEKATYVNMMPDLKALDKDVRDRVYLQGMIMHHEMAINMAQQLLALNPRSELKILGENVIKTQTAEIAEMQDILKSL